jgi:hypothetical protein
MTRGMATLFREGINHILDQMVEPCVELRVILRDIIIHHTKTP